jgi:hypothetical protein
MNALFRKRSSSPDGLTGAEAKTRLEKYDPNAIEEKTESALLKYASKRRCIRIRQRIE